MRIKMYRGTKDDRNRQKISTNQISESNTNTSFFLHNNMTTKITSTQVVTTSPTIQFPPFNFHGFNAESALSTNNNLRTEVLQAMGQLTPAQITKLTNAFETCVKGTPLYDNLLAHGANGYVVKQIAISDNPKVILLQYINSYETNTCPVLPTPELQSKCDSVVQTCTQNGRSIQQICVAKKQAFSAEVIAYVNVHGPELASCAKNSLSATVGVTEIATPTTVFDISDYSRHDDNAVVAATTPV